MASGEVESWDELWSLEQFEKWWSSCSCHVREDGLLLPSSFLVK
jgi:hypothetical protein